MTAFEFYCWAFGAVITLALCGIGLAKLCKDEEDLRLKEAMNRKKERDELKAKILDVNAKILSTHLKILERHYEILSETAQKMEEKTK